MQVLSQHGRPERHPANVDCSNFRYIYNPQSNDSTHRHPQKKWRRQRKLPLLLFSDVTQRCYKNILEYKMITHFQTSKHY